MNLATAPLADIAAAEKARREADIAPLKTTADMFERLALWTLGNVADDEQDLVTDMVAALTPHLSAEESATWWEELRDRIVERGKAEDGETPGDEDPLRYVEKIRDEVDFAAEKLAGAR